MIDDSVFVYQGTFAVPDAAALARAEQSSTALRQKQSEAALALAREAVAIAPGNLFAETSLGDAEAETGARQRAKTAWQKAIQIAKQLEPEAQPSYIPGLQANINRLAH
jgi:Flp pilus assembly protein TadD